jgi:hypothetical protein
MTFVAHTRAWCEENTPASSATITPERAGNGGRITFSERMRTRCPAGNTCRWLIGSIEMMTLLQGFMLLEENSPPG